jgi:hypothetical protein
MPWSFGQTLTSLRELMGSGKKSNALMPLCSFPVISVVLWYWAARVIDKHPLLAGVFVGIGALSLVAYFAAYLYFMFKQPHRLQSEWFQIRQLGLELIEAKGAAPVDPHLVQLLADPDPPPPKQPPPPRRFAPSPPALPMGNKPGKEEK